MHVPEVERGPLGAGGRGRGPGVAGGGATDGFYCCYQCSATRVRPLHFAYIVILFLRRLNAHLSSIVSSKPFQMPVDVIPSTTALSGSRLSSFGFSGTIAHGAFRVFTRAATTPPSATYSLYRRRQNLSSRGYPKLQFQTHRDLTQSSAPNYYAELLLQQSSMPASPFEYARKLQQEEDDSAIACAQSELICAAPGLTKQADLSVLVRAAAASSASAIHARVLLVGDHIIPVTNGRVKSLVTDEDHLMEMQAQNGGAISSQTILALKSTAPTVASMILSARLRGEDVTCVVPPPRSVRLRMTMEIPAQLLMERTCAVVSFRQGGLSLSCPKSPESPKVVPDVQPTRKETPMLDAEATRAAIFQCFYEFAEPELVVDDATLDSLGLDSLSVVELRNAIATATSVELDNATILKNPSVGEIIETVK